MGVLKSRKERAEERLKALEERRAKLNARIQRERAKLSQAERKRDTRRKILVGATILKKVEEGAFSEEKLLRLLDEHLEREDDRALFGLKAQEDQKQTP